MADDMIQEQKNLRNGTDVSGSAFTTPGLTISGPKSKWNRPHRMAVTGYAAQPAILSSLVARIERSEILGGPSRMSLRSIRATVQELPPLPSSWTEP
jgi:hypothetical protein